jgi:hypothetical protein
LDVPLYSTKELALYLIERRERRVEFYKTASIVLSNLGARDGACEYLSLMEEEMFPERKDDRERFSQKARKLMDEVKAKGSSITFRPDGSITVDALDELFAKAKVSGFSFDSSEVDTGPKREE